MLNAVWCYVTCFVDVLQGVTVGIILSLALAIGLIVLVLGIIFLRRYVTDSFCRNIYYEMGQNANHSRVG